MIIKSESFKKGDWFVVISKTLSLKLNGDEITLTFSHKLKKEDLLPFHIVTYACLIQYLLDKGVRVLQGFQDNPIIAHYIFHELGLKKYWKGSNHEEVLKDSLFNLWRIVESEKDLYSRRVQDYFTKMYFNNKDLSCIHISLVETFYNVFDHAKAENNAFFQMDYDEINQKLSVAIADLGLGIVNTVRSFNPSITTDQNALLEAIKDDFTISSTTHNKGKGLGNILRNASEARIVSGSAILVYKEEAVKTYALNYSFPGTLIYYDIDLSKLEEIDYLDEFIF